MVGPGFVACAEGWQVGAVVGLADDDRAVDVGAEEIDRHFAADARQEMAAPVGAGQPFGNPPPSAGPVVARRIAGAGGFGQADDMGDLRAGLRLGAPQRYYGPSSASRRSMKTRSASRYWVAENSAAGQKQNFWPAR